MPYVFFVASSFAPLQHLCCLQVTSTVCASGTVAARVKTSVHASTCGHVVAFKSEFHLAITIQTTAEVEKSIFLYFCLGIALKYI